MKPPQIIQDILDKIRGYIDSEKELIRLKFIQKLSSIMGNLFSFIFLIALFHLTMAVIGIWLGIWVSEMLGSFTLGFGVTALFFGLWLFLAITFRKPLIVKPFERIMIKIMTAEENIDQQKNDA